MTSIYLKYRTDIQANSQAPDTQQTLEFNTTHISSNIQLSFHPVFESHSTF